jgi:hypothetical protein
MGIALQMRVGELVLPLPSRMWWTLKKRLMDNEEVEK